MRDNYSALSNSDLLLLYMDYACHWSNDYEYMDMDIVKAEEADVIVIGHGDGQL